MIRRTEELDALDREYVRVYIGPLDYRSTLSRFAQWWRYARKLNPGFTDAWIDDVQADIELARVLNARPD